MDQTVQTALQNAAATQAALATVTWALGIAFTLCFAVVVAGVKALYTLKSDVALLVRTEETLRENHDQHRAEIKEMSDKLSRLENDFTGMRATIRRRNGFSG